ncbi:HAD family hydrolase [uncultured Friedmanniella sp.]|uniref:HAD family hydrolase n=1 Tax=uncultured Friedmanniella sp. TaxID=335381 RepID=UPI0035CABF9E
MVAGAGLEQSHPVRLPHSTVIDVVCWDWNGTLLDDTEVAMAAMNAVLHDRGLPVLPHVDAYRKVFGFPIQALYARLGVSDVDFQLAAGRYLELFPVHVERAQLHPGADAALRAIGRLGAEQVLISATIAEVLQAQLAPHAIAGHFDQILGITDAYASKADVVANWLESSGHDPRRVLMVGDTNHDEEIAEKLAVHFIRFARGHQEPPDHDRHPVVHHLRDIIEHLSGSRVGREGETALRQGLPGMASSVSGTLAGGLDTTGYEIPIAH